MLLNFKIENFKSFRDETIFSMIPSSKKTHSEFIIKQYTESGVVRALPVAVIYGANASGKSNIILAMSILKKIISLGGVSEKKLSPILSVMPFIHDQNFYKPTKFEISFYYKKNCYRYGVSILSLWGQHDIVEEHLEINGDMIFDRNDKNGVAMDVHTLGKRGHIPDGKEPFYNMLLLTLNENLDSKELFLSSGLKNFINKNYYVDIMDWFSKLNVVMNAKDVSFNHKDLRPLKMDEMAAADNEKFYESESIKEIINSAEFGNQKIGFISGGKDENLSMVSIYKLPESDNIVKPMGMAVSSELMESKGTLHLIRLIQPFVDALKTGGTIVLDEMDDSLHFEIVVSLIRAFNNKMLNKNSAQLIFNTHNPIYLDGELLRHDQIIMVEKDKKSLSSELYSLSDFGLRPEERILKNYLDGKYGSLPHMDLEIAFMHILEREFKQNE